MSNPYANYQTNRNVSKMIEAYHLAPLIQTLPCHPRMLDTSGATRANTANS